MLFTAIVEFLDYSETITCQIEADTLDQLMGRLKYLLANDHAFVEDCTPSVECEDERFDFDLPSRTMTDDPRPCGVLVNVWRAYVRGTDVDCIVTIIKTAV